MADSAKPLLVFDGDCAFCTRSASWIEGGWADGATAQAWQHLGPSKLQELGLTADDCREAAWWVDPSGALFRGHRAIGKSLVASRGWRRVLGRIILAAPVSPMAAIVYWLIARFRYRLPGGTAACRVPGS